LLRAVRAEVGDDVMLICGSGTNDTRHSRELTKAAAEAGADASLVVAPYYNKPNPAGLRAHFEAVAEAVPELPMIVYNIPARVVINMSPELLAELASIDNVVAVKQANDEELGPIEGLSVLAGNDNTFLRVLEFGGAGGITVASHIVGEQMREMWDAAQGGDLERARQIDAGLTPVYEGLSVTTNPIPLKAALSMLGLASDRLRLPLVPADTEQRAAVKTALEGYGLSVAP
jgi:4-hydroxy-tetrahydrodipicolinate synthase